MLSVQQRKYNYSPSVVTKDNSHSKVLKLMVGDIAPNDYTVLARVVKLCALDVRISLGEIEAAQFMRQRGVSTKIWPRAREVHS